MATASDPYIGSRACAECHQDISTRQAASPHALTLRNVDSQWAAGKFSAVPPIRDAHTGLQYGVAERGGRYYQFVSKGGRETAAATVDYLVGSGHHGISTLSFDGTDWRYLTLTYYHGHGWDLSPLRTEQTRDPEGKDTLGTPVNPTDLQKCLRCHSTRMELRGAALDPQRTELGVRCESCHGPGRAHVEAARRKAADLAINNPRKWSTTSFMALCQQCHNETSTVEGTLMGIPKDPNSPSAVKYHVYGLEQSRCFTQSRGAMRCTTCHDPHSGVQTDVHYYEGKCLSCHTAGTQGQKACPVNAASGCLPCHMPMVRVEKYTDFADHWIRAQSPFAHTRKAAAESAH